MGSGFGVEGESPLLTGTRCAGVQGFSLHANTPIAAQRRDQLEGPVLISARPAHSRMCGVRTPDARPFPATTSPYKTETCKEERHGARHVPTSLPSQPDDHQDDSGWLLDALVGAPAQPRCGYATLYIGYRSTDIIPPSSRLYDHDLSLSSG